MTGADKARLALLMPKITSFALQKIKEESTKGATFDRKVD
jgi:hypothetical protein